MVCPRFIRLFSFFLIIIAFAEGLAQQPGRKIAKIEIEGLVRLSADEVVATSGLKKGELFSIEGLDAAGQKLFDSGLHLKTTGDSALVAPPLIAEKAHIDSIVDILRKTLAAI